MKPTRFKIEVEDGKGIWSDVFGGDGKLLTFDSESAARAALAERYRSSCRWKNTRAASAPA